MTKRIEDYGLIGDMHTAALVSRTGSIDWLCLPRFDSNACFAALLGTADNGRWLMRPAEEVTRTTRRYRGDTLVLETVHETAGGVVRVIDFMPPRMAHPRVVRIVEGLRGRVAMETELVLRFDYGSIVPWVHREGEAWIAVAGPDAVVVHSDLPLEGVALHTQGAFTVSEGERRAMMMTNFPSPQRAPEPLDAFVALRDTEDWWQRWSGTCAYGGRYRDTVVRSLITLQALTYPPTGGIVAAPTTSLPEKMGGMRNWDYRFCWLRDATFTLLALYHGGFHRSAAAWHDWLLRAIAGDAAKLQIVYGLGGERRLLETELPWLEGFNGSRPVRVGNAASEQFQLDVYGEVIDAVLQARRVGAKERPDTLALLSTLADEVLRRWHEPDRGMWEIRGEPQHFTHSKVMAWVALDRMCGLAALYPAATLARWETARDEIHADICARAYNPEMGAFVQAYDSHLLDASTLLMPIVGFLPADDPRVEGTVAAIERHLMRDGFVKRYSTEQPTATDGLPPGEGVFLLCSFWLADYYCLAGRDDDARALFERLIELTNDLGLLAEEYDPAERVLLGNFPQAFSHVGIVNTALNLSRERGPVHQRSEAAPAETGA